ncbi:hypothetical protein SPI_08030 [Niveomyces insectorum RCEF 264]|uniref:Uncharacterized protein n=1 Tax=Niveomyces insectorum RCEF 264 TaxID=1081102 RepID=A0A167NR53_9HYPO|nr:hypothetical protein SPI_08030 [Niveomyces insectorum RCEF 264]
MASYLQHLIIRARPVPVAVPALARLAAGAFAPRSVAILPPPSSVRRALSAGTGTSTGTPPPHRAKKVWPPDFTRLSPQEQLRFEKRYKRRVALASARPRWIKFIKLVQLFSVTFVTIYCVLFMKWDYGPQPFDGVRAWFWNTIGIMQGGQRNAVRGPEEAGVAGHKTSADTTLPPRTEATR